MQHEGGGIVPKKTRKFSPLCLSHDGVGRCTTVAENKGLGQTKEAKEGKGRQSAKVLAPTQKRPRTVVKTPPKIALSEVDLF
jgi:hypothetical protein